MSMIYRLKKDVSGKSYLKLLSALLDEEDTFSLVWREQLDFEKSAFDIRDELEGLLISQKLRNCWPGTELIGHQASVIEYRCDDSAHSVLAKPGSIYGWLAPKYPEDLWFASAKNGLGLVTVTHEGDAWVLDSNLAKKLSQIIPLEKEDREPGDEKYFENAV